MSKTLEKAFFILVDFFAMILAFLVWSRVRLGLGYFAVTTFRENLILALLLFGFWFLLFAFYGHYQFWYTRSRLDEFLSVTKTITIGVLLIFLLTFDLEKDLSHPFPKSRLLIFLYWGLMVLFVGTGRVFLRTLIRMLLVRGIGRRKTLIVGWGKKAWELFEAVRSSPALGYDVVGFVGESDDPKETTYQGIPIVGQAEALSGLIRDLGVQEVLIALPRRSEKQIERVIGACEGVAAGIKIVPDLYDVMIGRVRTNQLYGVPLIEVLPQYMPQWERIVKRLLDFGVALVGLLLFLPFGLVLAVLIKIDSPGPIFYTQERVGLHGKHFRVIKFRSMIKDAEKYSGPVWAQENDPRVTRIGRWMRKMRLDEVPQLINVLKGDMSLVGPRPERPYFVERLSKVYPFYHRRLRVRPGLTGWAQVKGDYDTSIEKVKEKLEYDLYYLENMSFRMDLKILLYTVYVMLIGKGR